MPGAERKAELLSCGRILLPREVKLPVPLSLSSAGPGGRRSSLFFQIGKSALRLEVVRAGKAPLSLRQAGNRFDIVRSGRVVARDVRLLNAGFHAPGQAFINLHDSCRYNCAFCTLPVAPGKGLPIARWVELVTGALRDGRVNSVALTTGIPQSPSEACRDLAALARGIRRRSPNVPVGVEPYSVEEADLLLLRRSGAGELKLNIQCATPGIFANVCPGLDWNAVWRNIAAGVRIFGRGKVCSNLILGLGESDREAVSAVEELAGMGVAANLRPLRINSLNRGRLRRALGREPRPVPPSRLLKLAKVQKRLFERSKLDPARFCTMCHRCTACDLEPFRDV